MLRRLLGLDNVESVNYFELHFRSALPAIVAGLLVLCAVLYVAYLYHRERTLSHFTRVALGACRAVLLSVLIFLLFEPVLSLELTTRSRGNLLLLVDSSQSMAFPALRPAEQSGVVRVGTEGLPGEQDDRKKMEEVQDAAKAMGRLPYDPAAAGKSAAPAPSIGQLRTELAPLRRLDLVKGILRNDELKLLHQLGQNNKVDAFVFGDYLKSVGDGDALLGALSRLEAGGLATTLGSAVEGAVLKYGSAREEPGRGGPAQAGVASGRGAEPPVAGVVLFTDGAFNAGVDPLRVAADLKERGVPLYPVGIGPANPPDVRVEDIIVQDTVFSRDRVPLRVEIFSTGCRGRTTEFKVTLEDPGGAQNELVRKSVLLLGGTQYEDMSFVPLGTSGTSRLKVEVSGLPDQTPRREPTSRPITVIDDKIKVLYVEGMPRWEYRYLRVVLQRDPRLDVKFLMTEGDKELPKYSKQYLAMFPETAAEAFNFDLVILGEVPSSYFNAAQLAQIQKQVNERSGSLLVLAGRRYNPMTYRDSNIAEMLPVNLGINDMVPVGDEVYPVVTREGYRSSVTCIESTEQGNEDLWRLVKPLYQVPHLAGPKGGARVLLALPDPTQPAQAYPLVAWHRYGTGKCMYVGTDQLWRLRFKRGDQYHARFWGQAIQFLATSRLLGANKRIHLSLDRKACQVGEQVQIFADVLNEAFEPLQAESYAILVGPKDLPTSTSATRPSESDLLPKEVRLNAVPNSPGFYQGTFTPQKNGSFVIRPSADEPSQSNVVEFIVQDVPLEQRQQAMQEDLLRKMAEVSGGKYFSLRDLPGLAATVAERQRPEDVRKEMELWDVPAAFVVVVLLGGMEWYFRRRYNLV